MSTPKKLDTTHAPTPSDELSVADISTDEAHKVTGGTRRDYIDRTTGNATSQGPVPPPGKS